jgi:hypothetical protein
LSLKLLETSGPVQAYNGIAALEQIFPYKKYYSGSAVLTSGSSYFSKISKKNKIVPASATKAYKAVQFNILYS